LNQISQLTKNIAALQKIEPAVNAIKDAHWKSPEVRLAATLVRNTFDTFEQKWRDLLEIKNHKFFVFCIPRYPVLDGPPIFLVDHHGGDEINQKNFQENCPFLISDVTKIKKAMQDERTSLLNLQNQNELVSVFHALDNASEQLNGLTKTADVDKSIQDWDEHLVSQMKKYGLNKRFNTALGDNSNAASDRIARRETALNHIADSLSVDKQTNGGTFLNIGDNNTIGLVNQGDSNEFQQIAININTLSTNHKELGDSLKAITSEIENASISPDIKEQATDAILAISTELTKPIDKQRKFKIEDPWKKLETLTKIGDLALKVQPLLPGVWDYIVQHFPHLFL
jgi:hypothetical protein